MVEENKIKSSIAVIGGVFESFFDNIQKTVSEANTSVELKTNENTEKMKKEIESVRSEVAKEFSVYREEAKKSFTNYTSKMNEIEKILNEKATKISEEVSSIENKMQKELEQENLLGQTSKRTKRLASQARAQFGGQSGVKTGSLGRKAQV